jgi:hypothetical protein
VGQWVSLGVGAACLGILGLSIRKSIKNAAATESPLHPNPEHTAFLKYDPDAEDMLRRLYKYRSFGIVIYETIVAKTNALLKTQLQCESKQQGYRALATQAHEHHVATQMALDNLGLWITHATQSPLGTEFVDLVQEIRVKNADYKHNIGLVLYS